MKTQKKQAFFAYFCVLKFNIDSMRHELKLPKCGRAHAENRPGLTKGFNRGSSARQEQGCELFKISSGCGSLRRKPARAYCRED